MLWLKFFGILLVGFFIVSYGLFVAGRRPVSSGRQLSPSTQATIVSPGSNNAHLPAQSTFTTSTTSQAQAKESSSSSDVPVLMYHYIRVIPDPSQDRLGFGLSITPADFSAEMNYLVTHNFTTITPDELYAHLQSGAALPTNPILLTFDDGYEDFYTTAFPILKQFQLKATLYVVTGFVDNPDGRYITSSQLTEMVQSGLVTIGAHTIHHVDLTKDPHANQEITDSRTILEQKTGQAITSFAYPAGRFNDQVVQLVSTAGYHLAFTTQGGKSETLSSRLILPRVRVSGGESLDQFAKRLAPTN